MNTLLQKGFAVHDMCEMSRVRLYELGSDVPFEGVSQCPLCLENLKTLCVLTGNDGDTRVRVGACLVCGYIGYQDRPSQDWIVQFYLSKWDDHIALSEEQAKALPTVDKISKGSRRIVGELGNELVPASGRSALEIGSGYGQLLRFLADKGYATVVGVENSTHRAKIVEHAFGLPIMVGNFEGDAVQDSLKRFGLFDLVVTHHVFEHVADPEKFIAGLARIQPEGGVFVVCVPDVAGEHAGYVAFYPPHLHSYSKCGMERLLNRHGYELITDKSPTPDNMVLAFRKVTNPVRKLAAPDDSFAESTAKLMKGLGIEQIPARGLAQLWWLQSGKGYDDASVSQMSSTSFFEWLRWILTKFLMWCNARMGRFTASHGMLVAPLEKRFTDAPIEIQWKGAIQFLFK